MTFIRTIIPLGRLSGRLVPVLALAGCSVFEPVGSFIGQGYRNTVAYFNVYYNASRLYSEADEEIVVARRQFERSRAAGANALFMVPSTARTKLVSVIDKCSNILTFQNESDFVDDALLLIGKSYQHLGEHVKAERKFAELLTQFPRSDLRGESQARLGSVILAQGRSAEARTILLEAERIAIEEGDDDLLQDVLEDLARLHRDEGDYEGARRYYGKLTTLSGESDEVASTLLDFAQLLIDDDRPDEALRLVDGFDDVTDDIFFLYRSVDYASRALEALEREDEAVTRLDAAIGDFRFRDQLPLLRLRKASLLEAMGDMQAAIDEYTVVDTTFTRTIPGSRAAYALGSIYEERGAFPEARAAYERSTRVPGSGIDQTGRARLVSVGRVMDALVRLANADTALQALRDTVSGPDPRVDSLETLRSATMQEIGEWYVADAANHDSATAWLERALATGDQRPAMARALYILADIAQSDTGSGRSEEYYRRILREHPGTPYAAESENRLGISRPAKVDSASLLYAEAERRLEAGDARAAAVLFDSLSQRYAGSAVSARSAFASGWVYEYMLDDHDSAAVRYRHASASKNDQVVAREAQARLATLKLTVADSARTVPPSETAPGDGQKRPAEQDKRSTPTTPKERIE